MYTYVSKHESNNKVSVIWRAKSKATELNAYNSEANKTMKFLYVFLVPKERDAYQHRNKV